MNLLAFGATLFMRTTFYEKRKYLPKLDNCPPSVAYKYIDLITEFALNGLIDAIKISICFENYMKCKLLCNGYVIHTLDKNIFSSISVEQRDRPVLLTELLKIRQWENDLRIPDKNVRMRIKGISKHTLGMRELLSPGYQSVINLHPKINELCKKFVDYRNNLHYYAGEKYDPRIMNSKNLKIIIAYLNECLIPMQNELIKRMKKGEEYCLPIISQ